MSTESAVDQELRGLNFMTVEDAPNVLRRRRHPETFQEEARALRRRYPDTFEHMRGTQKSPNFLAIGAHASVVDTGAVTGMIGLKQFAAAASIGSSLLAWATRWGRTRRGVRALGARSPPCLAR